jgi:outer membrane lipoprotein carrier protein
VKAISLVCSFALILLDLILGQGAFGATGQSVLAEIQKRYESTDDLEANFSQEYIGKVMKRPQNGEGKVFFKKKGMMRWDYRNPTQKLISDGHTFWYYQPEENQVLVSDATKMVKEFGFLVGEGDLTRDFILLNMNESSSRIGDAFVLEIAPKAAHPAVSKLSLTVDKKAYFVVQIDVFDGLGNVTRTRFVDIKTNVGLSDSFFQFTIPSGAEVLKMQESPASPPGQKR